MSNLSTKYTFLYPGLHLIPRTSPHASTVSRSRSRALLDSILLFLSELPRARLGAPRRRDGPRFVIKQSFCSEHNRPVTVSHRHRRRSTAVLLRFGSSWRKATRAPHFGFRIQSGNDCADATSGRKRRPRIALTVDAAAALSTGRNWRQETAAALSGIWDKAS
jgi:hypothetical protein